MTLAKGVKVQGVHKRFCRQLRRSLWYGVKDLGRELTARSTYTGPLRKGEFWALRDIDLTVGPGECLALIGPNGSGKSTLLKVLNGLIKPSAGRVQMVGRTAALIELGTGFNPVLTGRENVYINGCVLGLKRAEVDRVFDEIVAFSELEEFIDTPVQSYSSGMKVRLGFAVASQLRPDILLIDEVLAVGDAAFRLKCFKRIERLVESGIVAITVSHNMNDIFRLATRGVVLDKGKMVCDTHDVTTAIQSYEAVVNRAHSEQDVQDDTPVRISGTRICDEKGQEAQSFRCGENIRIQVQLTSNIEADNITLILCLTNASVGDLAQFSNRKQNVTLPLTRGVNRFAVDLVNPPLLAGSYAVKINAVSQDSHHLLCQDKMAAMFQITDPKPDALVEYFPVRVEHRWHIGEQPK